MNKNRIEKLLNIQNLIEEINGVEEMIKKLTGKEDEVSDTMRFQYQFKKQTLVKELLIELILSDFGFRNFESLFQKIGVFLKKTETGGLISANLKSNLKEVEKTLA